MKNVVDEAPTRDLHGRLSFVREFVRLEDCQGKDMLDIGAGFGWFELLALDRGAQSIVGIEPRDADLATARRHVTDSRASFQPAGATELPYENASFDTLVCWEVLEHIPKQTESQAFREFARVLRPGGVLYLSTPHASIVATVTDPAWWLTQHRHYSLERVAGYTRSAGLTVDTLIARGGMWEILRMIDLYISKWILRKTPVFESLTTPRLDAEWERPGYTHVFLRAVKPELIDH